MQPLINNLVFESRRCPRFQVRRIAKLRDAPPQFLPLLYLPRLQRCAVSFDSRSYMLNDEQWSKQDAMQSFKEDSYCLFADAFGLDILTYNLVENAEIVIYSTYILCLWS